jgi:hypothetical protein
LRFNARTIHGANVYQRLNKPKVLMRLKKSDKLKNFYDRHRGLNP